MPSNQTPNYQLSQWERSDKIQMEDFNADNAKIDAALKAEADARTAADSEINTALSKLGNCRVERFAVSDPGSGNRKDPMVIHFSGKPALFLIFTGNLLTVGNYWHSTCVDAYIKYNSFAFGGRSIAWEGTELKIHNVHPNGDAGSFEVVAFYREDQQ